MSERKRTGSTRRAAGEAGRIEALRARLTEAEGTLRAIRSGEVDAVIVDDETGARVYALQSAEQPYRVLVEQMREGAAILTGAGDILYCNRRLAELAAMPLEEMMGGGIQRFFDESDRASWAALLECREGARYGRWRTADGRVLEVYVSLTTTSNDGVDRLNLIVTDLSELIDAQSGRDRAERDSQAKDEFMAMLAHELRNPLGAIAGAVQVLGQLGEPTGPQARARAVLTRQVEHLARLIDDLLETSRVVTGKMTLERRPVDWAEIVDRSIAAVSDSPDLDRHLDVAVEPVWIDADPVRIEQIVGNLLSNALKYTTPGGHIRVSVAAEGDQGVLQVEDDGIGIPADLLPRIFDVFVQSDQTLDRMKGGLGVGLTLVRRLVDLHGGTISAASEGPGRGSRFTVWLPRVEAPLQVESTPVSEPGSSKRRVLIIEDSRDVRDMYRLVLELAGHEVLEAEDGLHGLELLKAERPDVALVDIGLARLDGYELARRFRTEPDAPPVLLVALTGYGSPEDRERSRQAGFDHHLVKPVSPDTLRELLA